MPSELIEPLTALGVTVALALIGVVSAYGRLIIQRIERKLDHNTRVTDGVANGQRDEIAKLRAENKELIALVARLELLLEQHERQQRDT